MLEANQVDQTNGTLLHGIVERITFYSEESCYFVAQISVPGVLPYFTAVGVAPSIREGQRLVAEGNWVDSKYGRQFRTKTVELSAPTDQIGYSRYLSSILDGVGPATAGRLVAAFGTRVEEVLTKEPDRIRIVPGIGKKKADAIITAWKSRPETDADLPWLCGLGLTVSAAKKLCEEYPGESRELLTENPYRLAREVRGIGFLKADAIAQKIGVFDTNPHRIEAALEHLLAEAAGSGSCGLPQKELIQRANALLRFPCAADGAALLDTALVNLLNARKLMRENAAGQTCIFPAHIYYAEKVIAEKLHDRIGPAPLRVKDLNAEIRAVEARLAVQLEAKQRQAVHTALNHSVSVLTGGPGTGKTTITRVIVEMLASARGTVLICAPTGKAAKRATEAIGREASTIHRLLEWNEDGPQRCATNPLECSALVVDELSMVDVQLMRHLMEALPDTARLILVGDSDQLPSVGAGKVLSDLIESGVIPVSRLTEVFRQAQHSLIIQAAHQINHGEVPPTGWSQEKDFGFLVEESAEKAEARLLRAAQNIWKLGYHPVRDVQVLAPMRRGAMGVDSLNLALQKMLNPNPLVTMPFRGGQLGVGDKVIQTRNSYTKAVFNGEVGYVMSLEPKDRTGHIEFDGRVVKYEASDFDDLHLAYAFTIHRSQGSEFPVVLLGLTTQHFVMLRRNLVYTAVTRAKKLMLMFGSVKAANIAAREAHVAERYSRLKDWLRQQPGLTERSAVP